MIDRKGVCVALSPSHGLLRGVYPKPKMMMARRRRNHRISAKVLVTVCTKGPVARKPLRKYNDFHLAQGTEGRGAR